MPVPISVTHPKGAGLAAANPAMLDTSGPFARLAAAKEAAQRAAEADKQQQQQQQQQAEQQPQHGSSLQQCTDAGQNGACGRDQHEQLTVVVDHLDFAYPGLGKLAPWQFPWDPPPSSMRKLLTYPGRQQVARHLLGCMMSVLQMDGLYPTSPP